MIRAKEIKKQIRDSYRSLPKNQVQIADFVIEHFNKIPFLTVHELSAETKTSVASIVRFVQRVGFSGYSQFRQEIAKTVQEEIDHSRLFVGIEKRVGAHTLSHVANMEINNINETLRANEKEHFDSVIDYIIGAGVVATMGCGISYLLAELLAYQLTQVGIRAMALNHDYAGFQEQILLMKPNDLLIGFSFPPYSKETIDGAKYADRGKIPLIAITNKVASPISFYAKHSLIVKSENTLYTNSLSAVSVLINAIATECAVREPVKVKKYLKQVDAAQAGQFLE